MGDVPTVDDIILDIDFDESDKNQDTEIKEENASLSHRKHFI